jgi:hemerythrin-like metal-binding protein
MTIMDALPMIEGAPVDGLNWDRAQLVGVAHLDEQHRLHHRLVMDLLRTLETRPGDPAAEAAFIDIFENAVIHFRAEEDYLEPLGYPDLVRHRFEHELLLDWFRDQLALRDGPHPPPLIQLVKEIGTLFQQHHATVDQDYANWLRERGEGTPSR